MVKVREGIIGCGRRRGTKERKKTGRSYKGKSRTFIRFKNERGIRAEAWSLKGNSTALDEELSALVRGLELNLLRTTPDAAFNITDSQAAMTRLQDDRPGPGQHMATRGIRLATETTRMGATITIRWEPGHAGVLGNEIADQWALDAATREDRCRAGGGSPTASSTIGRQTSQMFMRTAVRKRAVSRWREEIARRGSGRRHFHIPREGEVPMIPPGLRGAPREVASRFF